MQTVKQAGTITLIFTVLACFLGAIGAEACGGASGRQHTIESTLHALDVGEAAFVDFDGKHQMEIVGHAANREDGEAKLAAYRAQRDKVGLALVFAYRAVATAAQIDDDPSVAHMVEAAALVASELATLGIKP